MVEGKTKRPGPLVGSKSDRVQTIGLGCCQQRRQPFPAPGIEVTRPNSWAGVGGKQAVVVMACDNTHISDDMILEPGLVMIFAHGIE